MKVFRYAWTALALGSKNGHAAATTTPREGRDPDPARRHRVLEEDLAGTYLVSVHMYRDGDGVPDGKAQGLGDADGSGQPRFKYHVETADGAIHEIEGAAGSGWRQGLKSGVDGVMIRRGATVAGAKIQVHGENPVKTDNGKDKGDDEDPVTGTKTVLAVRVINKGRSDALSTSKCDGEYAPTDCVDYIRGEIFGSAVGSDDEINLHDQYMACSHGQLDFRPVAHRASNVSSVTNITNGMVQVEVNTNCRRTGCDGDMRGDVSSALETAFGASPKDLADYVMYCLPRNAMDGIAYAYINSWNSVYDDKWCVWPSAQLHEIGHNINLAHSGTKSKRGKRDEYGDTTGSMGYSTSRDEAPARCFNNAKNWQLGWFPDAMLNIDQGESYIGALKGQANYQPGVESQPPVIIQINSAKGKSGKERKYYVGFNHAISHNRGTEERAANRVTIQSYRGSGYGQSWRVASLRNGQAWTQNIGGMMATVEVHDIQTSADGAANVSVAYRATDSPTKSPTLGPTSSISPTSSRSPTDNSTKPPCVDDETWNFVNNKGKELRCPWVGKSRKDPNPRCGKVGSNGSGDRVAANLACPAQCSEDCPSETASLPVSERDSIFS